MKPTVLISDFDNTLYDWFRMWHASFTAMLSEIERISGLKRESLYPEIHEIHRRYRTSEYAFLIEAIPSLRAAFPGRDLKVVFDDAIHAYNRARKQTLTLYPGVADTLRALRTKGVTIALYTDSLWFYTGTRIRMLELDGLIDYVYAPPDHELPAGLPANEVRRYSPEHYRLKHTVHRSLPEGVAKPDPELLLDIAQELKVERGACIYVGDSLMKDIAMAKDAGISDVWAEYGAHPDPQEYMLLQSVSHWPDVAVRQEANTTSKTVVPSRTIMNFSEIVPLFD